MTRGPGRLGLAVLALSVGGLAAAAPGAAAAPVAVAISKYAYGPAQLTVNTGDTVTWTNNDSVAHDVTSTGGPGPLKSSLLAKGQSYSLSFPTAGTFRYTCTIHPDMLATVTVKPAAMAMAPAPVPVQKPVAPAAPVAKAPTPSAPTTSAAAASAGPAGPVPAAPAAPPPSLAAPTEVAAAVGPAGVSSDTGRARINPLLFLAAVVAAVTVGGTITLVDSSRRKQEAA